MAKLHFKQQISRDEYKGMVLSIKLSHYQNESYSQTYKDLRYCRDYYNSINSPQYGFPNLRDHIVECELEVQNKRIPCYLLSKTGVAFYCGLFQTDVSSHKLFSILSGTE